MTAPPRTLDPLRRLSAAVLLATGVVGVPAALWWVGGAYLPDQLPSWAQVTAALSGPDTGAVFLGLLVVLGWAAWAVFALSVAVELATQLRGRPPLRLPGLAAPQQLAGLLVAAVVGAGGAPLLVAPALAGSPPVAEQPAEEAPPAPAPAPQAQQAPPAAAGLTYTVQPRDTLGRIAARHLGDWARFEEILDLNRGRPQPGGGALTDPGLVRAGWILVLPPDATLPAPEPAADEVVVQPGDTLVDIAEQHGLDSWQPIFDLNAGEPVPGGGRFTDPDLIRPGQVLDLPVPAPSAPAPVPPPLPEPPAPVPPHGDGSGAPADSPPTEPTPPTTERPSDADAAAAAGEADADQETPSELAAVLSGSGALLAAGVGAAWLAHRRRRLRRRRSGRRLAPLPAALSTTQTAVTAADAGRADYAALDRALRGLAVLVSRDPDAVLPDVVAARLDGQRLDLRLHTATDRPPPAPWTADETGRWWSLELDADLGIDEVARARLAPYPTLVTIGTDDGRRWLLDLECVGVLRLTGPADRCEDFARHLAAELGVNAWSDLLTVTTVGFGQELVDLAPERIRPVGGPSDTDLQAALGEAIERDGENALEGRLHATTGTGWMPHVVLAPLVADDGDDLAEAATTLESRKQRSPIVVVLGTESTQKSDEWLLTLTEDGHLSLPTLDVRLPAPQLTAQQARDIATLLAFERDTADQLIPAADGNRPWQVHTDAAGALRGDVLLPDESEPPDHVPAPRPPRRRSSVAALDCAPQPVDRAALAAPTAGEDAAAVDRTRTPGLRKRIEDDLEQLDRDLADWWDPDCARPRLALLGPVSLRAHGDEQAAARSGLRRRYEEAVAYLATRPHGATVDEAATALQPARGGRTDPVSARAYVHRITAGARAWLGTDPITGEKHLSSGHRGPYTLTNVLVDADLFRQLRARASVRGDDGMPDLLAALELVSGPPFAQRPTGYEWLDGLDLTLAAAICDVAHQVVTAALADDLEAARTACDIALLVAPDDEKVLLDAVWVAYREGHRAEAEMYIARIVVVHDGADEMDLPLSTAEIINRARRQYSDRAS